MKTIDANKWDQSYEQFVVSESVVMIDNLIKSKTIAREKINKKDYFILKADNHELIRLFVEWINIFVTEANLRLNLEGNDKKTHVGIDFEFYHNKIALMQINFESLRFGTIWLISPQNLDSDQVDLFADQILVNKDIYKIMHGAESMDLPYLFKDLLKNDKNKILKFMQRYLDTRFLCEYVRFSLSEGTKCSLYEAMFYFGTISSKQKEELEKIEKKMGPVQYISWRLDDLVGAKLQYAYFDVLYLQKFLFDIYRKVRTETPKDVPTYQFIIPMIRFVILERLGTISFLERVNKINNKWNSKFVNIDNQKTRLIDLADQFIMNLTNDQVDLKLLLSFGYFRKTIMPIFRLIIYNKMVKDDQIMQTVLETRKQLKRDKFIKILELIDNLQKEKINSGQIV